MAEALLPCAPVAEGSDGVPVASPPAAGPSPQADASPQVQTTGYCIRDLVAAGAAKIKAKSVGVIEPAMNAFGNLKDMSASPFGEGPCANPAKAGRDDLDMMCLLEVGSAWREWQRVYRQDGLVPQLGFDTVLPAYQYAVSRLDQKGIRYLNEGLARLDEVPIDWARPQPQDLESQNAVRKAAVRKVNASALNNKLRGAWYDAMTPVLEGEGAEGLPRSWWGPGSPWAWTSLFDGGSLSVVNWCRVAIQFNKITPSAALGVTSHTCADAAAHAWLMYETTGDTRFIDVTVGLRNMALLAIEQMDSSGFDYAKEWNRTFSCLLNPDSGGCPVGF